MHLQMRRWLSSTAIVDLVERGQASALQVMPLLIGAFGVLLLTLLTAALRTLPLAALVILRR